MNVQAELTLEGRLAQIITPSLNDLGYDLVKVSMMGDDSRKILQILIDRLDGANVGIDDCEKASRQILALLDVEEPTLGKYNLEVSSPGIDRPLTRLKDFDTYKGLEAKLEVLDKIKDHRKFRGRLVGTKGDNIIIEQNIISIENPKGEELVEIKFDNIKSAKLVLNDELLAMHKKNNI